MMRDEGSRVFEFLHPKLVKIITEEVKGREEAPSGWKTIGMMARESGAKKATVKAVAYRFLAVDPEIAFEYKTKRGMVKHFAPEVVPLIKAEALKLKRNFSKKREE